MGRKGERYDSIFRSTGCLTSVQNQSYSLPSWWQIFCCESFPHMDPNPWGFPLTSHFSVVQVWTCLATIIIHGFWQSPSVVVIMLIKLVNKFLSPELISGWVERHPESVPLLVICSLRTLPFYQSVIFLPCESAQKHRHFFFFWFILHLSALSLLLTRCNLQHWWFPSLSPFNFCPFLLLSAVLYFVHGKRMEWIMYTE